mgnify:CR=1 FL=1
MNYFTNERNIQIVISLLKQNNIKKIIVSPGATNITFVGSIQKDPFFELYSCIDERSAAYMACGMAEENGCPVVINCTGATSSRNWLPALTEAYYRKLPVLAISSSQESCKIGQLVAQVTNRQTPPVDTVVRSLEIGLVKDDNDEWNATIKANTAISLLSRGGGGPVHINLITGYSRDYSVKEIKPARRIIRYTISDKLPTLLNGRIALSIGTNRLLSAIETKLIDAFCCANNAVVFCDHTSGYHGKYQVNLSLAAYKNNRVDLLDIDLLIHFGEISGDYNNVYKLKPKAVWRLSPDGEIRDLYHTLVAVFDMTIVDFFTYYSSDVVGSDSYINRCNEEYERLYSNIPDLPFSNLWIAKELSQKLPSGSKLYLGILNSLRSWNFFKMKNCTDCVSNTGGFGIDGILSSLFGASFCNPNRIYFGVLGDLSFFYDLNSLGNRHIANNVRIILVNNGLGQEFINCDSSLHNEAFPYIAAEGHNGNKSSSYVKGMAESLGYKYLSATTKEEFLANVITFVSPEIGNASIVFEVFTDTHNESEALSIISRINQTFASSTKQVLTKFIKDSVGDKGINTIKKLLGKS